MIGDEWEVLDVRSREARDRSSDLVSTRPKLRPDQLGVIYRKLPSVRDRRRVDFPKPKNVHNASIVSPGYSSFTALSRTSSASVSCCCFPMAPSCPVGRQLAS